MTVGDLKDFLDNYTRDKEVIFLNADRMPESALFCFERYGSDVPIISFTTEAPAPVRHDRASHDLVQFSQDLLVSDMRRIAGGK